MCPMYLRGLMLWSECIRCMSRAAVGVSGVLRAISFGALVIGEMIESCVSQVVPFGYWFFSGF